MPRSMVQNCIRRQECLCVENRSLGKYDWICLVDFYLRKWVLKASNGRGMFSGLKYCGYLHTITRLIWMLSDTLNIKFTAVAAREGRYQSPPYCYIPVSISVSFLCSSELSGTLIDARYISLNLGSAQTHVLLRLSSKVRRSPLICSVCESGARIAS